MEWIRVTVHTATGMTELLCGELSQLGISGFEIEDAADFNEFLENNAKYWDYVDDELRREKQGEAKVKFYIKNDGEALNSLSSIRLCLEALKKKGADFGTLETETDGLNEEDWANNWKKYFKPTEVGEKILIQPQWCPYDKSTERIVFTVNPGMTFGTGTHTSTRLCICELEKYVKPGCVVLDAGCGSGILSIIALMLGAGEAAAVDIDENCAHVVYENMDINHVDRSRCRVYSGDITKDGALIDKISEQGYDIIVANIVADVIIALLPTVRRLIKRGGVFICSGIIEQRLEDVKRAMAEQKVAIDGIFCEDGWAAVTCKF